MATYAQMRDALVAALESVSGVGDVHNYRRLITDATAAREAFTQPFGADRIVQFADVDLASLRYDPLGWGDGDDYRMGGPVRFTVRIFRGLNDAAATGRTFAALLETAVHALSMCMRALVPRLERVSVTLVENNHRMFAFPGVGDVLAHYGELAVELPNEVVF